MRLRPAAWYSIVHSKHVETAERKNALRRIAILLALVAATTLLAAGVAFTQAPEEDADSYIVVLEDSVDNPSRVAQGIDQRQEGFEVGFVYSEALEGFSAEIPDDSLADVRNNPQVDYVERDKVVTTTAQVLPWGVDRIDADLSSTLAGNGSGEVAGVNVYVIDTGIDDTHADLNVVHHENFRGGPDTDCDGHGTHVAGTLAAIDDDSDVVGVAPGASLTSVKVLGCNSSGTTSNVVKGVDWVTANAQKPAVANMSLGGGRSKSLNTAVRNSAASGVFYSLAAGNEGRSACKSSPAMTGAGTNNGILTTAATNENNKETTWSNFGRCVDLWAPGRNILSTKLGGGITTMSGTSMAAPHADGTAALYLSAHSTDSPAEVEADLKAKSTVPGTKSKGGQRDIRLVNASEY
jgi:subtilisin family serine protease